MRVVLTGASGQLGTYLVARLAEAGHVVIAWSGSVLGTVGGIPLHRVELTDPESVARALKDADPEAVLHAAALSTVDAARRDPARAQAVNVEATATLADWCGRRGRRFIYTSTDLVFGGLRPWSREDDPAEPVLVYGRSKLDGEASALASGGLVARLSLLFGPSRSDLPTYLDRTFAALRRGVPQTFFEDEFRTPLDLSTAAGILTRLLVTDATGLLHVAGRERLSRFELVRRGAVALGLDPALVSANRQADVPASEPRPADVSLDTARLAALLPDLERPTSDDVFRRW